MESPRIPSTLLRVDPDNPAPDVIARAAAQLTSGGLVAFPTETVYGLGADALNPEAVARIYAAKGRPAWNPLIAHVADVASAQALTTAWPAAAQTLADRFWPGPLTLVLPKHPRVPDITTAGLPFVAVRVPSHPVALALLRAVGRPIAAPSANRFTHVSPTSAAHVLASLGDRAPMILDGGSSDVGIESTVLDLSGDVPRILRPGMLSRRQLEDALGAPVAVVESTVRADDAQTAAQMAPGAGDRHYAPRADVWLFETDGAAEVAHALVAWRAGHDPQVPHPVTALLRTAARLPFAPTDYVVPMPDEPGGYARSLYAALHAADANSSALVLIEVPPDIDEWRGVRDRLARAAR